MPFTKCRYHLVFPTYRRTKWLRPKHDKLLYPVLGRIVKNGGGMPFAIGGWNDHVHLICDLKPNKSVAEHVSKLKSQSAGALKRHFDELDRFRWSGSYGAFSVSEWDCQRVINYVRNQKARHGAQETWPDWERCE
jgi:REP element-mobilizing transposase RayT